MAQNPSSQNGALSALDPEIIDKLIDLAAHGQALAYAPYSNFKVGCSVLTTDGNFFHGCNVENSSLGLTICAERTCLSKAVSEGHLQFRALCIITDVPDHFIGPCGACRQFIAEFGMDFPVIMVKPDRSFELVTMHALLPYSFDSSRLREGQKASEEAAAVPLV